jgi:integrase
MDREQAESSVKETKKRIKVPGFGSLLPRGRRWWIAYSVDGREHRESAYRPAEGYMTGNLNDARRLLKARAAQHHVGQYVAPDDRRLTLGQLRDLVPAASERNGRRSTRTTRIRFNNLVAFLGEDCRIGQITTARLVAYQDHRREGAANPLARNSTINREMAALHKGFTLAKSVSLLNAVMIPQFPGKLEESPPREGYVEPSQLDRLVKYLPDFLVDLVRFTYLVGWRRGAVVCLRSADVDREHRRVYLRRAGSKNRQPYTIVLVGKLREIIERRCQARSVTRADGTTVVSEFVFHRHGGAIGDFRDEWDAARKAIGLPGLRLHDFRRSAARNLDKAGVSQTVSMSITGHETASMFRRYRIVDEGDIERALTAVQAANSQAVNGDRTKLARRLGHDASRSDKIADFSDSPRQLVYRK